jgi:hypothetical protein
MKIFSASILAIAILVCLASSPVDAQERGFGAVGAQERGFEAPLHLPAVNPSLSLSAPANNPLQDQMREDYATGLMNDQRELLQQNPSGVTREERAIEQQLNGYTPQ